MTASVSPTRQPGMAGWGSRSWPNARDLLEPASRSRRQAQGGPWLAAVCRIRRAEWKKFMEVWNVMRSMPNKKHKILIVDDHPLVREWLANLINQQPDLEVAGEAQDVQE